MDEQVYAMWKSTRVLLEPFRTVSVHLATRLQTLPGFRVVIRDT